MIQKSVLDAGRAERERWKIADMFNNFQPAVEFVPVYYADDRVYVARNEKGSREKAQNFINDHVRMVIAHALAEDHP